MTLFQNKEKALLVSVNKENQELSFFIQRNWQAQIV